MEQAGERGEITMLQIHNVKQLLIKMFTGDSLLFLKAEENNVRKALEIVQLFSIASGSQCNIEKSRLISLSEEDSFDTFGWTGDIVHRGNIVRHLGIPIEEGTTYKQAFDWIHDKIQKKIDVGSSY